MGVGRNGFSETNTEPVLLDPPQPLPAPVKPTTLSTAGSCCTMAHHLPQLFTHRLEGDALIGLQPTEQASGVLLRKKTLGHDYEQCHVEANRGDENQQDKTAVAQHPMSASAHKQLVCVEQVRSERASPHAAAPLQKVVRTSLASS